jgi:hypothetical protein
MRKVLKHSVQEIEYKLIIRRSRMTACNTFLATPHPSNNKTLRRCKNWF